MESTQLSKLIANTSLQSDGNTVPLFRSIEKKGKQRENMAAWKA